MELELVQRLKVGFVCCAVALCCASCVIEFPLDNGSDGIGESGAQGATTSDESGTEAEGEASFAEVEMVFADHCVSGCHEPGGVANFLDLRVGWAHESLVGRVNVAGLVLVAPGDTTTSYLWHKLRGTHLALDGGTGDRMPDDVPWNDEENDAEPLSSEAMARINSWISSGAEN